MLRLQMGQFMITYDKKMPMHSIFKKKEMCHYDRLKSLKKDRLVVAFSSIDILSHIINWICIVHALSQPIATNQ